MRNHQHQTVDRRQDPAPEESPERAGWRALEAESAARVFAGGTSPGNLFDEGDDEPTESRLPSAADRTQLWQVMTARAVCVTPDLETEALTSILDDLDLRAVPVVDAEGRPIGVVSRSDLLRRSRDGADRPPEKVVDVMMSLAFSLPKTASLSRAAAVMAYECVHRIPVVALDGTVVGIISSLDIVRWLARHDGYLVPGSCGGD